MRRQMVVLVPRAKTSPGTTNSLPFSGVRRSIQFGDKSNQLFHQSIHFSHDRGTSPHAAIDDGSPFLASDTMFETRYGRPTTLTSKRLAAPTVAETSELLATSTSQFGIEQYSFLFAPYAPAGAYEEMVHFLPYALDFLRLRPTEGFQIVDGVIWFISEYRLRLATDDLLEAVQQAIRVTFSDWTQDFKVVHLDGTQMSERGSSHAYGNYVWNSDAAIRLLEALAEYNVHLDLCEEMILSLVEHPSDWRQSAWLLEIVRQIREHQCTIDSDRVNALAHDTSLLSHHYRIVKSHDNGIDESYWHDLSVAIGLH